MTNAAIELRSVTRVYESTPPIIALDNVSATIEAGEMVAVVGPSGSGKSTMLNIMGTLDRPTSGTVLIDGIDTRELSERQLCRLRATHLGFVFQGFHLIESASILDNVANGLLYRGSTRQQRRQMAQRALELVELGHRSNARPSTLSGGQRQRVAIARAIVGEPTLVLADEPTGNLDSVTSAGILSLLSRLNEDEGATIVIITHDPDVAAQAERRMFVSDGKLVDAPAPLPSSLQAPLPAPRSAGLPAPLPAPGSAGLRAPLPAPRMAPLSALRSAPLRAPSSASFPAPTARSESTPTLPCPLAVEVRL